MAVADVGASTVLEAVREFTPEIAARAEEIERARQVPADIIDRLRDAGAFRMLLPRAYGGEELDMLQTSRVLEEVGVRL